jgi:hypothetical protein
MKHQPIEIGDTNGEAINIIRRPEANRTGTSASNGGFEFAAFVKGCNLPRPISVFSGKLPRCALGRHGAALTNNQTQKYDNK